MQRVDTIMDQSLKKMMIRVLSGSGYKAYALGGESRFFHETLLLLQERGWITPSKLADKLGYTEESVDLWFEKNASRWPHIPEDQMEAALQKVSEILEESNNHAND